MATTPITQEKVHKAKLSIENFYANLINQYEEREERYAGFTLLFMINKKFSFVDIADWKK